LNEDTPPEQPTFELDTTTSGEDGLSKVDEALQQHNPYAVIYLDMRMPSGWDGLTTAKKIRAIDPEVSIIFITAYSDRSLDDIRHQLGIKFDFLRKPFIPSELLHLTHLHAEHWHQQSQLQLHKIQLEAIIQARQNELQRAKRKNNLLLAEKSYDQHELELILNAMREGVIAVDHRGNITHANRSIERLCEKTEQQLLGTPAVNLFSKSVNDGTMGAQTLTQLHTRLQQLISNNYAHIEAWIEDTLLPVLLIDESGTILNTNPIIRNVIQWEPQQLIGNSLDLLLPKAMRKGHAGLMKRFFQHPRARKMGRSQRFPLLQPDETLAEIEIGLLPLQLHEQKRVLVLLNDPAQQQWWELFSITPFGQLFFEEGDLNMGVEIPQKEGANIPVYISSSPLYRTGAQREQHHGAILVVHDLRTALTAEREQRANLAKDQFLASTSHELRTPLTTIIGNCEILIEQPLRSSEQEMVHSIDVAGRGLLSLINDMLDLSKIEAGKFQIDPNNFKLSELLQQIRHIFSTRIESSGLNFEIIQSVTPEHQLIGDPQRITQILINLLGNAIKFTEEGFIRLRIDHLESEEQLRFSVEDSGVGIDAEAQKMLFQPYRQADSTISKRFGGTGLGLHISRILAELMGGSIELERGAASSSSSPMSPANYPTPASLSHRRAIMNNYKVMC
jgi:signal transduction histidine kinase/DNA-binding response OmpR family regulator